VRLETSFVVIGAFASVVHGTRELTQGADLAGNTSICTVSVVVPLGRG